MLILDIFLFLLFCVIMVISGTWLVKATSKIASFLRISEFIVSFIIIAVSTSLPELFVGITSALAKNPSIALGCVIGSNIADLTIIIGIPIVLSKGIKITSREISKDSLYMFFIAALPIALMLIGNALSRLDGAILIIVFAGYIYRLLKQGKKFRKEPTDKISHAQAAISFSIFAGSAIILFLSAKFVVQYATSISNELSLPPILIGLFLVAIGTSLPELIFNIQAVLKNHPEMAIGDTVGSVVANSTLILGVTAIIYPITDNFLLFFTSSIYMLVVCFLFATFMESGKKLYIKEGIALILLYSFYLIIEYYIKMLGG